MAIVSLTEYKNAMNKAGYHVQGIDEELFLDVMELLEKEAFSYSAKAQQLKANYIVELIKDNYKSLRYIGDSFCILEHGRKWRKFSANEEKVFVTQLVKVLNPVIYSPEFTARILTTLKEDPEVVVPERNLDPIGKIAFLNGYLDVDKLEFHDDYNYIFTHQIETEYTKEVNIKEKDFIDSFIYEEWNDKEKNRFKIMLYGLIWYALKGRKDLKKMFVLYGRSNTGKSVFPMILSYIIGDRFKTISGNLDVKVKDQFFLAHLTRTQVLYVDEVRSSSKDTLNFLKSMTTGLQNVLTRVAGGKSEILNYDIVPIMSTNEFFKFREDSNALKTRLIPLHFNQIQEVKAGWSLAKILTPQVLNDIINKALYYGEMIKKNGFDYYFPDSTKALLVEFLAETDPLGKIIKENVVEDKDGFISWEEMRERINIEVEKYNKNRYDRMEYLTKKTGRAEVEARLKKLNYSYEWTRHRYTVYIDGEEKTYRKYGWSGIRWDGLNALKLLSDEEKVRLGYKDEFFEVEEEEKEQELPF